VFQLAPITKTRVTRLGNFLLAGLLLEAHCDFFEKMEQPKEIVPFGLLFAF
jgi:hypothetical protein